MDLSSALIINHEVRQAGSFSGAAGSKMLDYYSREGEFREDGGCDRSVTDADRELEGRMSLRSIDDLVDYGSRAGRYEGRNPEMPLAEGERSGTCFGQHGLVDPEDLKRELAESGSHLVTSVVSVRREDAERLGLATKEGFQNLLRKEWTRQCEQWGVIRPQDIRWAAWFHTDNERSVHVHVVTWDRSGRFSEPGALIPRSQVWSSQSGLRREALKDSVAELNRERSFLRDYVTYRVKLDLGRDRDEVRESSLARQAAECGSRLADFSPGAVDRKRGSEIRGKVVREMPADAVRALSYARSNEAVRNAALAAVADLRREDRALDSAFRRYEEIVREVADGIALRNDVERVGDAFRNPAAEYCRDAVFDLNRRAANSVLKSCSPVDLRDVHRHRDLVSMRETATPGDSRRYAERFVSIASEKSETPLPDSQRRALEHHAEKICDRIAGRAEREAIEGHGRPADSGDGRFAADAVLDLVSALSMVFSGAPHGHEHGSYEGMFDGRKPRRIRDEHARERDGEIPR